MVGAVEVVGLRDGWVTVDGQVWSLGDAGAGPVSIKLQPGSCWRVPWTVSLIRGGLSGQLKEDCSEFDSIKGGQAEIWPLLSVLAQSFNAAVRTVMFQPFRKSPWKP